MTDLKPELIKAFTRLFRGRVNVWGQYYPVREDEPKKVKTKKEPPPAEAWENHLRGTGPYLGIVPITEDNTCYWAALDLDDDGIDLIELEQRVAAAKLPLTVCRSKSGGAHLYIFFSEPVAASVVVSKLEAWRARLSLITNADGRATEIFPKQTRLKPSEQGNWINLPYYGGDDTNRYAVVGGKKLTLLEFVAHARTHQISEAQLREFSVASGEPFFDGPPCLQTLHAQGLGKGARNQGLFNIALYFKLVDADRWPILLAEYNQEHVDPPLEASEIETMVKGIERRDYVYKCEELPIQPLCAKAACKKQKYGIKAFREARVEKEFPPLLNLVKVLTDPPLWYVTVGVKRVELTTDDLLNMQRFRRVCLERVSIIVPTLRQDAWDGKIDELLKSHTEQEVPEDAGYFGQFKGYVHEFIQLRRASRTRDDLLLGKPFQEGDTIFFRSADLMNFLDRKRFREYDTSRVYTALKQLGASHKQLNVKGANIQVWTVPAPANEQTQPLDMPLSTEPSF